jgi:4a-hydroxytetrahydrobiopterin dehydratase
MDMLSGDQIQDAHLTDWRKLAQGLHARYVVADFAAAARLLASVGDTVEGLGDHLRATVGNGFLDLKLITLDAVYRDGDGNEHEVEWVTEQDLDLARRISGVAAEHGARMDTAGIMNVELALDTAHEDQLAPFWSALLTGGQQARGRGTIGNDVRDGDGRVPYLVPGDRRARDATTAFPPRRVRAARARTAAHRRGPGRRRRRGQPGGRLHDPRRP